LRKSYIGVGSTKDIEVGEITSV